MTEEQLIGLIDPVLRDLGSLAVEGEEFRHPPLDVVRYYDARSGSVLSRSSVALGAW